MGDNSRAPRHQSPKWAIRGDFRDRRAGLPAGARESAASAVAGRVLALPELATARVVAAYAALPDEVPADEIVAALVARGITVLLPVLLPDRDLAWGRYDGDGSLAPARFGLREPAADPAYDVASADVLVVPGVAFDRAGTRLGRGGGSYDRALARARPDATLVGLAWDDALVDSLPAEAHDVRVTVVVTPSATLRVR